MSENMIKMISGERHVFVENDNKEEPETNPKPKSLKIYLILNYSLGLIIGILGLLIVFYNIQVRSSSLFNSGMTGLLVVFYNVLVGLLLLIASALLLLVNFYVESYNNRARHICLGFSSIVLLLGILISNIFILVFAGFDLYVLGFDKENISLFNQNNSRYHDQY